VPPYPLDKRLGGPQNPSGGYGEVNILDLTGIRISTPVTVPTALLQLTICVTWNTSTNKIMIPRLQRTASVAWWSEFLATDPEARVRFPALPEKESIGSGTGST
jgi:hypothetical protein